MPLRGLCVRCMSELFRTIDDLTQINETELNKLKRTELVYVCVCVVLLFVFCFAHLVLGIHWLRDIFLRKHNFTFHRLIYDWIYSFCCDIWLFLSHHWFLYPVWCCDDENLRQTTNDTRMWGEVKIHMENFGPKNGNEDIKAANVWQCSN